MDIASLRRELEEHLKLNPHEQAPEGFRDRFDHWAEAYEAADAEEDKAELEALLRRVPAEAEAAVKCGAEESPEAGEEPAADDAPEPKATAPAPPAPPEPSAEAPRGADAEPAGGGASRSEPMPEPDSRSGSSQWLILAAIALALAAAAYFYLAR